AKILTMDIARTRRIMLRGLKLRCPACGKGRVYRSLLKMNDECPYCHMVFAREQGYFIGAIYVNVIATESLIFFTYLLSLLVLPIADPTIYVVLLVMALILPLAFFRHARSIWLSFDYVIDPPKGFAETQ
ncbi:MAG TPA: DUF983 domain-containing protein, partial [Blastocatellia bacterium]|nr:DUF983 domain-containing protein [Blastocatellia bacterium]